MRHTDLHDAIFHVEIVKINNSHNDSDAAGASFHGLFAMAALKNKYVTFR